MAEPFADLSATTALGAVGVGSQIGGAISQAIEAQRIGRYNARLAQANAQAQAFNDQNEALQHERLVAMLQDELGVIDAATLWQQERMAEQARQVLGMQRAIVGASGLAPTGSPLAVEEAQLRQYAIQELAVNYQAALQKRAVREEQTQQTYAATLARFQAGERLRLGSQTSRMVQVEAAERTQAGIFEAAGRGIKGAQVLNYLSTKQQIGKMA
jgi:hypothetical protein